MIGDRLYERDLYFLFDEYLDSKGSFLGAIDETLSEWIYRVDRESYEMAFRDWISEELLKGRLIENNKMYFKGYVK